MRFFTLYAIISFLFFPVLTHAQVIEGPYCLPAPSGLTAWWPLDDTSGTVIDDITGGFHGEAGAPIGEVEGPGRLPWKSMEPMVLGALGFAGNAFIRVPHHEELDPGARGWTIDFWLQVAALAADEVTVLRKGGMPGKPGWRIYMTDPARPTLHVEAGDTTGKHVFSLKHTLSTGTWHFVGVTLTRTSEGADSVSLFINGEQVAAAALDTLPDIRSTEPLLIGGDGTVTGVFALDEIEIYRPPLDEASLRAIFLAGRYGKCRVGRVCIQKFNDHNANGVVDITVDRNGYVIQRDGHIPGWTFYVTNASGILIDSLVTTMGSACLSLPARATYTVSEETRPDWVHTTLLTPLPYTFTLNPGQTLNLSFGNHQQELRCAEPPRKMSTWWPLDDTTGASSVRDIVGGLDGTPMPGGTIGPPSGPLSTAGKVGKALHAGGGSYVRVGDHAYLNPSLGEFSLDAWIYIYGGRGTLIRKMQGNGGIDEPGASVPLSNTQWTPGYILYTEPFPFAGGYAVLHYGVKAIDGTYLGGGFAVPEGKWHHVALVLRRQGSLRLELYVNGQLAQVGTGSATLGLVTNTYDLLLGGDGNDNGEWILDEVEIFRKALSPAEVWSIYNADSLGKCRRAELCFLKFNDLNGDGVQNPPYEVPMQGWTISVQDTAGAVVDTVYTRRTPACVDVDAPGTYVVEEQLQPGWTPTTPNPQIVSVEPGASVNVVFGNQRVEQGTLCVLKFEDTNGNGVQDSTETLLNGWWMTVQDSTGNVVDSLTTLVTGPVCTTLPAPGTYMVEEQLQPGWTPTTPNPQVVTLQAGQVITLSFGNQAQTSGCVAPPDSMVGWWTLDAPTGTLEADIAGTPQNGSRFNNPTPAPGMVGGALKFDGIDDFVSIPHDPALDLGISDFTLDFWMRADTSSYLRGLISKRQGCYHSPFLDIRIRTDGRLHVGINGPNGINWIHYPGTMVVTDNQWHHVAVVRQGSTSTLYIDGTVQGSFTAAGVTNASNTRPLILGWSSCIGVDGTQPYDGYLDEVEYFNRALTLSEIQAIFQARSAGKCKPATGVEERNALQIPYAVDVYPNPSLHRVLFRFTLPRSGPVTLKVYDLWGREVAMLRKGGVMAAGTHEIVWKPGALPSGVYFYRFEAGEVTIVGSLVRVK